MTNTMMAGRYRSICQQTWNVCGNRLACYSSCLVWYIYNRHFILISDWHEILVRMCTLKDCVALTYIEVIWLTREKYWLKPLIDSDMMTRQRPVTMVSADYITHRLCSVSSFHISWLSFHCFGFGFVYVLSLAVCCRLLYIVFLWFQ